MNFLKAFEVTIGRNLDRPIIHTLYIKEERIINTFNNPKGTVTKGFPRVKGVKTYNK